MLWCISRWFLLPSLCWNSVMFSNFPCDHLVEFLEVKLTEVWVPCCDWFPVEFCFFFTVGVSTLNLQQFFNCSSSFSSPAPGSFTGFALVSCNSLYLPIYLSNLGGSSSSCDLILPRDLRNCWFFSLFRFLLSSMGSWFLSFLHAGPETRRLPELLITTRPHVFSLTICVYYLSLGYVGSNVCVKG